MQQLSTSLTPAQRRLVEFIHPVNYGRIEGLAVRNGQPVFDPPPRRLFQEKFSAKKQTEPKPSPAELATKPQVAQLIERLSSLSDETVVSIEIQNGLPFLASWEG